jgi:hypothetical protein
MLTRLAWPLVVNFCCPSGTSAETCTRSNNIGWRYIDIVLGSLCLIMSIACSFALEMHESPRLLVPQGRTEDAVAALITLALRTGLIIMQTLASSAACYDQISVRTWLEEISSIKELFLGQRNLHLMSCLFLLWALVGIWYTTLSSLIHLNYFLIWVSSYPPLQRLPPVIPRFARCKSRQRQQLSNIPGPSSLQCGRNLRSIAQRISRPGSQTRRPRHTFYKKLHLRSFRRSIYTSSNRCAEHRFLVHD